MAKIPRGYFFNNKNDYIMKHCLRITVRTDDPDFLNKRQAKTHTDFIFSKNKFVNYCFAKLLPILQYNCNLPIYKLSKIELNAMLNGIFLTINFECFIVEVLHYKYIFDYHWFLFNYSMSKWVEGNLWILH